MFAQYLLRPSRPGLRRTWQKRPQFCAALVLCIAATVVASALQSTQSLALPDDKDQPIHISADKALRDERKGVTVYSGNVEMRQGTMEVDADKITFYHAAENANQVVAVGKPAKMRLQPELDKGFVYAEAETIRYFRAKESVRLRTSASIEQDGALVKGDSIDYLITEQLIKAQSDQSQAGDKVNVVIPPTLQEEVKGNDSEPSDTDGSATIGDDGGTTQSE